MEELTNETTTTIDGMFTFMWLYFVYECMYLGDCVCTCMNLCVWKRVCGSVCVDVSEKIDFGVTVR